MPELSQSLKSEYEELFNTCNIREDKAAEVEALVDRITASQGRYAAVQQSVGVPWYVIGLIQAMENAPDVGQFQTHLHNGDPLTARTVHVPAGRPPTGDPPFAWEVSAVDALQYEGLDQWADWGVAGICYKLEGYNGWGSRNHGIHTPYLWSFSNHYSMGKYIEDNIWSATAVSQQCGAAVLLRRMAEKDPTGIAVQLVPDDNGPLAQFDGIHFSNDVTPGAAELQTFLNHFPRIWVKVDGKPGRKTSDAFHTVMGHYLQGDPDHTT